LTLAGPYLLRATLSGEQVGVEDQSLLWVMPSRPVVPIVDGTGCPDRFGNVVENCARLKGVPSCAATLVAGRGLSILSEVLSSFSVVPCDALQTPLSLVNSQRLKFRVLVNNVSTPVAPGGLVSFRAVQNEAEIEVFCNGRRVPGSPWRAVRPPPSWRTREEREMRTRQSVVAPPVTAVAARISNLGNSIQV
jgi:hypothetical protein